MAGKKLDDRLQELRLLRRSAHNPENDVLLRKAFMDRSNLVIAEAARSVSELHLTAWIPDLLSAFDRLFVDPVKSDAKCWGKTAIIKALTQLDYSESPPFLRGLRHIQKEPVYGGQEDSAPQLRANCTLALVQCTDISRFEVLRSLVDAMCDPADPVRIEAVRALNQLGGDESLLLLRLKARLGDPRPLIMGHVFDALLNMERDRALSFIAEFLKSKELEIRDEAALALGSSRLASALQVLIADWKERPNESSSGVVLRAISSSALPEAIEFLVNIMRTGQPRQAAAAAEALTLHEDSPEIQALIERCSV